jgi:predicted GIY-YIG superfamily endonuclease
MIRTKFINESGIYQILSKNGKRYIGSSIDVKRRINEHQKELIENRHANAHLQNHANKYGISDLCFKIIEFCEKQELIIREQLHIDKMKPEFNICKKADSRLGVRLSEEAKVKFQKENNPMYGRCGELSHRFCKTHTERTKQKMRKPHPSNSGELHYLKHHPEKVWNKGKTKEDDLRILQQSERMKNNTINTNRICSFEKKKKTSETMKAWYATKEGLEWIEKHSGENNPSFGKTRSEDVKRKISEGQRKRWADKKSKNILPHP